MSEHIFISAIPQYGGLAVISLFAFYMLKAQLKALEGFNRTLSNHFRIDQELMTKLNESLTAILNELRELRKEK